MKEFPEMEDCIRWYPCHIGPLEPETIFGKKQVNLYVHLPYCKGICLFCPFNRYHLDDDTLNRYLDSVLIELDLILERIRKESLGIRTVWVGGGTPTELSAVQLDKVLTGIRDRLDIGDVEYTVEAIPGSVDEEKIKVLRKHNVTRISLGVQSLREDYLLYFNRRHTKKDVLSTIALLRESFDLNIDIMFRLPGQTAEMLEDELREIGDLDLDHVTFFPLFPTEGTPLFEMSRKEDYKIAPKEEYYEMYSNILGTMAKQGLKPYTAYHFARPGKESRYIIDRWRFPQKETFGIGAGSVSYMNNHVYSNLHDVKGYNESCGRRQIPVQSGQRVKHHDEIVRKLMLGLNMLELDMDEFKDVTDVEVTEMFQQQLEELRTRGFIRMDERVIKVTLPGMAFFNEIAEHLYSEEHRKIKHPKGVSLKE